MRDLSEFFDPDLYLPIRGRTYRIPDPSYEGHKRMHRVILDDTISVPQLLSDSIAALGAVRKPVTDNDGNTIGYGEWSGGALDDMIADGVPWSMILHAGRTALMHFGGTPELAEVHWSLAQLGRSVDLGRIQDALAIKRKGK